jgi:hypothetical protein
MAAINGDLPNLDAGDARVDPAANRRHYDVTRKLRLRRRSRVARPRPDGTYGRGARLGEDVPPLAVTALPLPPVDLDGEDIPF